MTGKRRKNSKWKGQSMEHLLGQRAARVDLVPRKTVEGTHQQALHFQDDLYRRWGNEKSAKNKQLIDSIASLLRLRRGISIRPEKIHDAQKTLTHYVSDLQKACTAVSNYYSVAKKSGIKVNEADHEFLNDYRRAIHFYKRLLEAAKVE